eukprot:scaffold60551_cov30-Tisochrysis_lutea.AAC.1
MRQAHADDGRWTKWCTCLYSHAARYCNYMGIGNGKGRPRHRACRGDELVGRMNKDTIPSVMSGPSRGSGFHCR